MIFPLVFLFCFTFGCQDKESKVERIIEDGVEVIVNHLEPYKIIGEPYKLILEEMFTIDTERDEIAELGLTNIKDFDVDSDGSIYFFQDRERDVNLIYKFDKNGNYLTSFGKRGQGPGEIQTPIYQRITAHDEIPVQNSGIPKLYVFDRDGILIRETQISLKIDGKFIPLENGKYLLFRGYFDPTFRHRYDVLSLYNSKWEEIKELDRIDYGPFVRITPKKKGTPRVFIFEVTEELIYVGQEKRGYEILIFDLDGKLFRKLKKEYKSVKVPDEFKENLLINFGSYRDKLVIPEKMPSFHYFFLDDEGRLYVKTYEIGKNKHEYIHDVFNSDGIFIARKSMAGYGSWMGPGKSLNRAKAKNQQFYCIREKDSGFRELVVYKARWE